MYNCIIARFKIQVKKCKILFWHTICSKLYINFNILSWRKIFILTLANLKLNSFSY